MFILTLPVLISMGADADPEDPDSLIMEVSIDLRTVDSGTFSVMIMTDDVGDEMTRTDLNYPSGIGYYKNDNLVRVIEALKSGFSTNKTFFNSFISSSGKLYLSNTFFGLHMGDNHFGLMFSTDFDYGDEGFTREYSLFGFSRAIEYPRLDRNDPMTVVRRNDFIREVELCSVYLSVEVEKGISLDLQFESRGHVRTINDEYVRIQTNLHQVSEEGKGMKISRFILFSPGILFSIVLIISVLESIAIGLIWLKNRFKGLGLVIPSAALISIPFHLILFFNPHVNIYGTHDSFLFASIMLSIGLITVSCFFNPSFEKVKTRSYEEEKSPSFRMPKVIYSEKNVYIRSKDCGNGIDPYEILGVPESMSTNDIRKHYKKQILRFHPDRFHDSPDRMKDLAERETGRLNRAFEMILKIRGEKD